MADEQKPPAHDPRGSRAHSVPRGQRLRDALDPEDGSHPNVEHRGGFLKDGARATPEELEEHGLQPGGSVARRMRRGEL